MVYGLCRSLLRDPEDADDATQATFVSAYTAVLGGTTPREPAAWLATIARNECGARAKARMREPLPLFDEELAGSVEGPEAELERRAEVGALMAALRELPETQREAVVLRDLYGLHYSEVGAALGISIASVESLLFRARRSLRFKLKPVAGGALVVPVAVREGIAQALPGFASVAAAGSGVGAGGTGLALLAKLGGGPAGVKIAAGIAAIVAAGSATVVGAGHEAGHHNGGPVSPRGGVAEVTPTGPPVELAGFSVKIPSGHSKGTHGSGSSPTDGSSGGSGNRHTEDGASQPAADDPSGSGKYGGSTFVRTTGAESGKDHSGHESSETGGSGADDGSGSTDGFEAGSGGRGDRTEAGTDGIATDTSGEGHSGEGTTATVDSSGEGSRGEPSVPDTSQGSGSEGVSGSGTGPDSGSWSGTSGHGGSDDPADGSPEPPSP